MKSTMFVIYRLVWLVCLSVLVGQPFGLTAVALGEDHKTNPPSTLAQSNEKKSNTEELNKPPSPPGKSLDKENKDQGFDPDAKFTPMLNEKLQNGGSQVFKPTEKAIGRLPEIDCPNHPNSIFCTGGTT